MDERYDNLDLLRAFAATAVVVYHVIELSHWNSFPVDGPLVVFRIGWLGVDLFFVISGFVITKSALALWRDDRDAFQRRYWLRRLTRIVPLYLMSGALWIALFQPAFFRQPASSWLRQTVTHVTFTHPFFPWSFSAIDGVNWTIGIEMQFYLLIALFVPLIARASPWRLWAACIAIAWCWRAAMVALSAHASTYELFTRTIQLPGTLDEFGAGIFLARLLDRKRACSTTVALFWAGGAVAVGLVCFSIYWPRASYWEFPAMVVFWRTSLAVFFLCVVAAAVHLPDVAAARPLRPVRYVGQVSYGIYLWHLLALGVCARLPGMTPALMLFVGLVSTLGMASLSWHLFERPIVAFGRGKSGMRPVGARAAIGR